MKLLQIPASPAFQQFISLYRIIAFELPDMSGYEHRADRGKACKIFHRRCYPALMYRLLPTSCLTPMYA